MRKILILAGTLSLLAAPAFATSPQNHQNEVQPGTSSSGMGTQGTTRYRTPKQSAQAPAKHRQSKPAPSTSDTGTSSHTNGQ